MEGHKPGDFISYPLYRVAGTIATPGAARRAIEELIVAGVPLDDIDVLHGEQDIHRLDPTGADHGFLSKFQRTLINTLAPTGEADHLRRHVDDVLAGRVVIMVVAEAPELRTTVAATLKTHGAVDVGFYGRWMWQSLD